MICVSGTHDTLDGQAIAAWYGIQVGLPIVRDPYSAIGWLDDAGEFRCATLFDDFNGSNIELHVAGHATRQAIRTAFRFAFNEAGCCRMTAKPKRSNRVARLQAIKVGFVYEGVLKRYYGPKRGDDAVVYRLDRHIAERWMK